jgi:cytochrome c553
VRAFKVVALALAGVAVLCMALLYGVSEWRMRRHHEVPLLPLRPAAPPDPVAGLHMARVVGCWAGCHGPTGEGGSEAVDGIRRITAPTLTQVIPLYSDEELARLVRYGVKRDGRSAVGMHAGVLWPLGEQDLADIIAHLRSQPRRPAVPRMRELSLRGRLGLVTGAWKVSADQVDRNLPRWGELPLGTPFERGRYLASIVCAECHGLDLRGDPVEGGPALAIIAIYGPEHFARFMRTGKPLDGRALPKMSWLADVGLTEREIEDLYLFLREFHGLPVRPPD